eukprot:2229003-Rhodomonas_salina.3
MTFVVGCMECGAQAGLKACQQCKTVHYCSGDCQKKDWPEHKRECLAVKAARQAGKAEVDTLQARAEALGDSSADPGHFQGIMSYLSGQVTATMWDKGDEQSRRSSLAKVVMAEALTKIIMAEAPLRE